MGGQSGGREQRRAGNEFSGSSTGSVVQSGHVEQVNFYAGPGGAPAVGPPHQLPPATSLFTGRAADAEWLDAQWAAACEQDIGALLVVSGTAGVGKSTLALSWLHAHRGYFPDGQLYADLAGYSLPDPVEPAEVLGGFLRALGVGPESVPVRLAERVALLRTVSSGRSVCLLLDNALSAAQVRILALTAPGCATLVTTRSAISGLTMDGARFRRLETWRATTGVAFLRRALGEERVTREPEAAERVAELCGGLPLALGVAAAKLASRPRWTINRLAEALARDGARLELLDVGQDSAVMPALDGSYQILEPEHARLYRALGRCPVLWFDAAMVAAVLACDEDEAESRVEALVDAHLLEDLEDRYRFHDLVRLHAAHCAETEESGQEDEALGRLLDFFLAAATAAEELMTPSHRVLPRTYRFEPVAPIPFRGEAEALAWLDRQRPNLMAVLRLCARRALHRVVWQLADAMWPLFLRQRLTEDRLEAQTLAAEAARADGRPTAEGYLLISLSSSRSADGDHAGAAECCDRAIEIYRGLGDPRGLAQAYNNRAKIHLLMREWDAAEDLFHRALERRESIGYRRGVALTYQGLGRVAAGRGDLGRAERLLRRSQEGLAREGDRYDAAWSLALRAHVIARLGEAERALGLLDGALAEMRAVRSGFGTASILEIGGRIQQADGATEAAAERYERAAELFAASDPLAARRVGLRLSGSLDPLLEQVPDMSRTEQTSDSG
jgi:tetratricopeptide (TPR) repeat protein